MAPNALRKDRSRRRTVPRVKHRKNPSNLHGSPLQIMLPKTNNLDAFVTQAARHSPVAFAISSDFRRPERRVLPGCLKTLWAAMPKAPVNKDS